MEANSKANAGGLKQSPHTTEEHSDEIEHAPELTKFQEHILRVLAEIEADGEKQYGLHIKRRLESYYGEEVNHGRLYPNLDTLIEEDLLEKIELDKRTNKYELTERGRRVLTAIASNFARFAPDGVGA
ncbi:hypothetical protein DJ71_18595 [Halorubrum sp. E3]|nr:hypothetical protein DJ71_18595 [Halorubrum sp. E3]